MYQLYVHKDTNINTYESWTSKTEGVREQPTEADTGSIQTIFEQIAIIYGDTDSLTENTVTMKLK